MNIPIASQASDIENGGHLNILTLYQKQGL